MLIQLHIENVAVIEKADIDFSDGFNVLTGETGAGKSIIIDSINAVTGEKTSKDIIRAGAAKAKISAVFGDICTEAYEIIGNFGIDSSDDGILMLSRELSTDGRSVFRINGTVVPSAAVKQLSPYLINIHGQHDNQQLFSPSKHIVFVDGFAGLSDEVEEYRKIYSSLCDVKEKIESLSEDDEYKKHRKELLTFQFEEINSAELVSGEETELISTRDMIRNAEELTEYVETARELLVGDEESDGAVDTVKRAADAISAAAEFVPDFSGLSERINTAAYELEEILTEIRSADGRFDYDKEQSEYVDERLDLIHRLKQKYGSDVDEIIAYGNKIEEELAQLDFSEQNGELLNKELVRLTKEASSIAKALSEKRMVASKLLCESIMKELVFLDMPNVKFSVERKETELKSDGYDHMEFLVSANAGEELKPLTKIASGGELSRIMLAIKTVLSKSDRTGTLIFDEIDAGVSGKTARKIGEKMYSISKEKQVLCVTHLAQIASLADNHLLISKKTDSGRTYTSVRSLDSSERIGEVARIMGGEVITEATLSAAKELIDGKTEGH